jgi:hypothetical protein
MPRDRWNSSTRSAASSSLMRLLITDLERFSRVAADVTLPASITLMNVRMSSKRQFIGRCWLTRGVFGTSPPLGAERFAVSRAILSPVHPGARGAAPISIFPHRRACPSSASARSHSDRPEGASHRLRWAASWLSGWRIGAAASTFALPVTPPATAQPVRSRARSGLRKGSAPIAPYGPAQSRQVLKPWSALAPSAWDRA